MASEIQRINYTTENGSRREGLRDAKAESDCLVGRREKWGWCEEREEERKEETAGAEQREDDGCWCQERPLFHAVSPHWL